MNCPCPGAACKLLLDDLRHGTQNGYGNCRCRCTPCRAAHNANTREMKALRSLEPGDPRHGTVNGYRNYNCRCRPCTTAASTDALQRAHRLGYWKTPRQLRIAA